MLARTIRVDLEFRKRMAKKIAAGGDDIEIPESRERGIRSRGFTDFAGRITGQPHWKPRIRRLRQPSTQNLHPVHRRPSLTSLGSLSRAAGLRLSGLGF